MNPINLLLNQIENKDWTVFENKDKSDILVLKNKIMVELKDFWNKIEETHDVPKSEYWEGLKIIHSEIEGRIGAQSFLRRFEVGQTLGEMMLHAHNIESAWVVTHAKKIDVPEFLGQGGSYYWIKAHDINSDIYFSGLVANDTIINGGFHNEMKAAMITPYGNHFFNAGVACLKRF